RSQKAAKTPVGVRYSLRACTCPSWLLLQPMLCLLRFIWNSTRGHRLAPWRSPYLLWRIETYCGVKMQQIGFLEFWEFLWRERHNLWRFLKWTGEMDYYARPTAKKS